ncbi:MAG TPA: YdeI/OmpD-associated family protein [Cyclobacteriaceae bacterium]|nr:YdeI/OmpD-associated family protein [Cyclobacteriaceae bacterium]
MAKETAKPLVNKKYLLKKIPGKGGWTYATIPEVMQDKHAHFGWVKVKGSIDGFNFNNYRLMPMGDGHLFLPVRAEIRKKIGKEEGDFVHIVLYADNSPTEIPEELLLCLKDEPEAYKTFLRYSDGEQKAFIDWIYSAKTEDKKVERIAKTLDKLSNRRKFTDK